MLNMTQINLIRDLAKSGYKISEIHEMTKSDPKTITKYLEKDDFSPEPPIKNGRSSIVAPFHDKIMEYLEEDKKHWTKQRHTAKRIFERLRDEEGYQGSYDAVPLDVKIVVSEKWNFLGRITTVNDQLSIQGNFCINQGFMLAEFLELLLKFVVADEGIYGLKLFFV
mgnify:CR=1 FL=1